MVGVLVGDCAPAPIGEGWAKPLSAAQHELLECRSQFGVVRADVRAIASAVAEISRNRSVTVPASSTADGAAASTLSGRPFPVPGDRAGPVYSARLVQRDYARHRLDPAA